MRVHRQRWETLLKPEKPPEPDYPTLPPVPPTRPEFIERAMIGRMSLEDQAYMARAILSLSDENAEMKERIEAAAAYAEASERLHGEFGRVR